MYHQSRREEVYRERGLCAAVPDCITCKQERDPTEEELGGEGEGEREIESASKFVKSDVLLWWLQAARMVAGPPLRLPFPHHLRHWHLHLDCWVSVPSSKEKERGERKKERLIKYSACRMTISTVCPCFMCVTVVVELALELIKVPLSVMEWFISLIPC